MGAVAGGEDQLTSLLTRAYETVVGGFHERAIHSFTKAQSVMEAASAGKLAAVAASAAAVAGGGYAVERQGPGVRSHDKPLKTATRQPAKAPVSVVPVASTPPPAVHEAAAAPKARSVREFGAAVRRITAQSPEFTRGARQDAQFIRAAAASAPASASASASPGGGPAPAGAAVPRPAAPEFRGTSPAPEFGG
jgi:hypothetical protein